MGNITLMNRRITASSNAWPTAAISEKKDTLVDYGSGKGRVSIFMTYQTGCRSIGIEYDERLWQKAMVNAKSAAARSRVSFILADAAEYELPDENGLLLFLQPLLPCIR